MLFRISPIEYSQSHTAPVTITKQNITGQLTYLKSDWKLKIKYWLIITRLFAENLVNENHILTNRACAGLTVSWAFPPKINYHARNCFLLLSQLCMDETSSLCLMKIYEHIGSLYKYTWIWITFYILHNSVKNVKLKKVLSVCKSDRLQPTS